MSEENKELTPVQKVKKLEYAVLYSSPEEVAKVYAEVGKVELSARALGYAFRYRGAECVKALVEGGANLEVPFTNYMINTYGTYGDDYIVMLLDNFPEKGIMLFVVTNKIYHSVKRADGTKLEPLPFEKRLDTVKYLCEHGEKAGFIPGDLLYFAILFRDEKMIAELKKLGIELPEYRRKLLTDKGKPDDLRVWTSILERMSDADFAPVLSRMAEELGGEKFHNTKGIYEAISKKLYLPENLKAYLEYFDDPTPNKTAIIKSAIDKNSTEGLAFAEQEGWLKQPKKRDEMIQYAVERKSTECAAWLLDFKNRTADLAEERVKADKKQQRELNASPDSVTVLKTLWRYKKRKDGTIIINGYKGTQTEIIVPAKIGKSPVTAIADEAFSPYHDKVIVENGRLLLKITSVTLPESITEIGERAFSDCYALRSVNIPNGVTVIKKDTFFKTALENIILPSGLNLIGDYAFFKCGMRSLAIPEGVTYMGFKAFANCEKLETVKLPGSLNAIGTDAFEACSALRSVDISNGVSEINNCAFSKTGIETIVLPESLRTIRWYAFSECGSLKSLVIPEGVTSIGYEAISKCGELETVELPRSFTEILPGPNIEPYFSGGIIFSANKKLTVIVPPGSFAEQYCKKYNLHYKLKGEQ